MGHTLHKHAETLKPLSRGGESVLVHVVSCVGCLSADPQSAWWQGSTSRERRDRMALEFDHVVDGERNGWT